MFYLKDPQISLERSSNFLGRNLKIPLVVSQAISGSDSKFPWNIIKLLRDFHQTSLEFPQIITESFLNFIMKFFKLPLGILQISPGRSSNLLRKILTFPREVHQTSLGRSSKVPHICSWNFTGEEVLKLSQDVFERRHRSSR